MKSDVGNTYADPCEERRDGGEILKPCEDSGGAAGATHVGQE